MKVLILGGYGVFGGQLCRLLAAMEELDLIIAGRSLQKSENFINSLEAGAKKYALKLDRNDNLEEAIKIYSPDLIIDATGPFQNYGNNPYKVVEVCLNHKINYMDFSDSSEFVDGIVNFDEIAKTKGVFVLSGVSSFPILTASVVRKLEFEFKKINSIVGGIAPSPYARVGINVIKAITSYAGKKIPVKQNGVFKDSHAFVDFRRFTIAATGVEPLNQVLFSLVDVPDLRVLPKLWPEVETVWMGAGPAPETLHRLLRAFSRLVKWRVLPSLLILAPLFHFVLSNITWGKHRGGMFVEIAGEDINSRQIKKSWHLIAEGDDGPFIPAMALVAIIKRCLKNNKPLSGARSGAKDLELDDYEELFKSRRIVTSINSN